MAERASVSLSLCACGLSDFVSHLIPRRSQPYGRARRPRASVDGGQSIGAVVERRLSHHQPFMNNKLQLLLDGHTHTHAQLSRPTQISFAKRIRRVSVCVCVQLFILACAHAKRWGAHVKLHASGSALSVYSRRAHSVSVSVWVLGAEMAEAKSEGEGRNRRMVLSRTICIFQQLFRMLRATPADVVARRACCVMVTDVVVCPTHPPRPPRGCV